MPISYEVDESQNFVYVKTSGHVTEQDFLQHAAEFMADPRIKPGFRELFDATSGTPDTITRELPKMIQELENVHEEKYAGSKIAFVTLDTFGFDLAKEYERQSKGTAIVFFSIDVAKRWLGYDGPLLHKK